MNLDKVMMIPFLSKELDLIGYPELPYKLKRIKKKNKKSDDKCSSSNEESNLKIVFDNNQMIDSLLSVSFDLVKEIKKFHEFDYKEDDVHRTMYDNQKLLKQLNSANQKIKDVSEKLSSEKEKYRQINSKFEEMEKQLKKLQDEKKKSDLDIKTSKDLMHHELKKKEMDLAEAHKILWRKFNMVDKNYLPKNFEIMRSDNPDFKRLWSDVRYSGCSKKEDVLKSAICKYQENNNIMFEDNILLKSVLLTTLEEINDFISLIRSSMKLDVKNLSNEEIFRIFQSVEGANVEQYKNYLNYHLNFLKILFKTFDETQFQVGDKVFICWSDSIQKIGNVLNKSGLKSYCDVTEM